MADWCHEIDFRQTNGSFSPVPNPWTGQVSTWVEGEGWKSYDHPAGGPDSANQIERIISTSALTRIELVAYTDGPYCNPYGCSVSIYKGGYYTPANILLTSGPFPGDYTYIWDSQTPVTVDNIGLHQYDSQYPTMFFRSIKVYGMGVNPFTPDENNYQTALDNAFTALRSALQANPSANVDTLVANYKTAIQNAFGVLLTDDSAGSTWNNAVQIHFMRQGLETSAKAFESWAENELDNECIPVDRFDLFKRIMSNVRIKNVTTVETFPAQNTIDSNGPVIEVYQRPQSDGGGQWYMTPNNVIHELGHWFANKSGFGFQKIGSLTHAVDLGGATLHNNYSRAGMAEGRTYLRARALEHGKVTLKAGTTDTAEYNPLPGKSPVATDSEYNEFVPGRYLYYDVASDLFSVWRSSQYYNRYGENARIDTLVQNETADKTETTADAFLNWVRDLEYLREYSGTRSRRPFYNADQETNASAWINFFGSEMGRFLRNAAIYHYSGGMVQYYKDQGVIPQISIDTGSRTTTNYSLRLNPQEVPVTAIALSDSLPTSFAIYGWLDAGGLLGDGISTYWLLVEDAAQRLIWIASAGIGHDPSKRTPQNAVSPTLLDPSRAFTEDDFSVIIGE